MITINITEIVEPVTVNISEGILEVQAGDNVNVDNTDPLRPVVSSDALVADVTEQAVLDALGYTPEDEANKQTDLTSEDAAHYPNVPAVNTGLTEAQTAVAGIDVKDYTGEAGTTHTYTILTTDVGRTLRFISNLDDVVTLEVGNDIDAAKPITIMKEFEGELVLTAIPDMVITGEDVESNEITFSSGVYETFQIIKLADNLIRVI